MAEEQLQDLKEAYNREFDCTKRQVHEANERIELLRCDLGESDSAAEESANEPQRLTGIGPKLKFLKAQHASNKHLLDILNTNHAALNAKDIGSKLSLEDRLYQIDFYKHAKDILVLVKDSVSESLMAPPSLQYYAEFENIVMEWKDTVLSTSAVVTVGAMWGYGLLGNWHPFVWLPKAVVFSHLATGIGGLAAPVLAVVVVAGIVEPFAYILQQNEDGVAMRKKLDEEISLLKTNPLPIKDLLELRNMYERAFRFPLCQPTQDDECIVCQEKFQVLSASDNMGEEALGYERAPSCHGRHFVHKQCLLEWREENTPLECTACKS